MPPEAALRDPCVVGDVVPPPYYFGIHPHWIDIKDDAFGSSGWIDHCRVSSAAIAEPSSLRKMLRTLFRRLVRGGDVPKHLALPLAESKRATDAGRPFSILDVGGGYGDNFLPVAEALGRSGNLLRFDVVDNERSRNLGEEVFAGRQIRPAFHDSIPAGFYNLVIVIGTLHYIEDWRGFITTLGLAAPEAIYISRTPLRMDGDSFITVQSICPQAGESAGRKVGEACVNIVGWRDLEDAMRTAGYGLAVKSHNTNYSAQMGRLPESHRNIAYVDTLWRRQ